MVIAGYQKKSRVLSDEEKRIVAYHEVGHALVAAMQSHSAPVQKITIIPRTSGALGYTLQVDEGDHFLMSKEELLNKIATYTGGQAAEKLVFHSITTGASVSGPIPLPTKKEVVTILRAVHKYKDSREQFERRTHKRLIDVVKPSPKTVEALMSLELPAGVEIEIKL